MGGGEDFAYSELMGVPFLVKCSVGVLRRVIYCGLDCFVLYERDVITFSHILSCVANGIDVGSAGFE